MKQKLLTNDIRKFELDSWQKRVLNHNGNIALRCSRQSGKSTAVALKARKLTYDYPNSTTLILAPSLRQSTLLYEKIRAMLELDNTDVIREKLGEQTFSTTIKRNAAHLEAGIFLDKLPSKSRIRLKNGSQILVESCGDTGNKVRGFSVHNLIVDEAQEIPPAVWVSIIPMLATSKKMFGIANLILLGTPKGKHGYFYECFGDKDFKHIHVKADDCSRITRTFLKKEQKRLTTTQYAQEYLAEFVASVRQYFPSELIDSCGTLSQEEANSLKGKRFLGADFARFGGDSNAYCEAVINKDNVAVVWAKTEDGGNTTTTMGFIKFKDDAKKYNKIFIDSGGLGGTILDVLQETISKRRVIGLDNSQRRFQEAGEEKKQGIFKEDLYMNAKILMEQGKLKFIKDPYLISGLKGISFEYSQETGKIRIRGKGKGTHIVESFVRAVWGFKNQGLDLWVEL